MTYSPVGRMAMSGNWALFATAVVFPSAVPFRSYGRRQDWKTPLSTVHHVTTKLPFASHATRAPWLVESHTGPFTWVAPVTGEPSGLNTRNMIFPPDSNHTATNRPS